MFFSRITRIVARIFAEYDGMLLIWIISDHIQIINAVAINYCSGDSPNPLSMLSLQKIKNTQALEKVYLLLVLEDGQS